MHDREPDIRCDGREGAAAALRAVTRVLGASEGLSGPADVRAALVREALGCFAVERVALLGVSARGALVDVSALDRAEPLLDDALIPLLELPCVGELVRSGDELARVQGEAARALAERLRFGEAHGTILLASVPAADGIHGHVLVLAHRSADAFPPQEVEIAAAFVRVAGAALAQVQLAAEQAGKIAQTAALRRAAQVLHEPLALPEMLLRIAREATWTLDADNAAVLLAAADGTLEVVAVHHFPERAVGMRLPVGSGLAGRIVRSGRALFTNEYDRLVTPPLDEVFGGARTCLGVPLRWDGELRGVLSVGYAARRRGSPQQLRQLEPFAELAALACREAGRAGDPGRPVDVDPLTGCLGPTLLARELGRELDRSMRTGHPLTLVLLGVDELEDAGARHGELVGSEVLRRIGFGLRSVSRRGDHVARFGSDGFAIVAVGASESEAAGIAQRAIEQLPAVVNDVAAEGAMPTAGVAEWDPQLSIDELIDRADRALRQGRVHRRGGITCWSELAGAGAPGTAPELRPLPPRRRANALEVGRFRKRARQLLLLDALGTRLATLESAQELASAVAGELHRALGHDLSTVARIREDGYVEPLAASGEAAVRNGPPSWCRPRDAGLIGRCLRERCVVGATHGPGDLAGADEPAAASAGDSAAVRSELAAPVHVGGRLWGALHLQALRADAFDEDDGRLLRTVAEQLGAALRVVELLARVAREDGAGTAGERPVAALPSSDAVPPGR